LSSFSGIQKTHSIQGYNIQSLYCEQQLVFDMSQQTGPNACKCY